MMSIFDANGNEINVKSSAKITTALLSSWVGKRCTVNISEISGTDILIVSPDFSSQSEYESSGCRVENQNSGSITFKCDTVPTSALYVNIIIMGGETI